MRYILKLTITAFFSLSFLATIAQTSRNITIIVLDEHDSYLPGVELTFPNGLRNIFQGTKKISYRIESGSQVISLVDSIHAEKEGYVIFKVEFYVADDELVLSMKKIKPDPVKDELDEKLDALQEISSHTLKANRNIFHSRIEKKPINKARIVVAKLLHNNIPINGVKVVYHELDFKTDDKGKVKIPLNAAEDPKLYIEGYKVTKNKLIGEEIEIETEKLSKKDQFVQTLSLAAIEIEKEQKQFEHTNERLTSHIEDVLSRLKNDKNLTAPERKELQDYLKLLTESLEKNDSYYVKSKVKRDSLLQTLNALLLEKDAQNKLNLKKIKELEEQEKAKQAEFNKKIMVVGGVAVLLLLLAGTFIVLSGKLQKQKKELEVINGEVLRQKEEISTLYTDISDNISVAKTIQNTILPTNEIIRKEIPEAFVFYHPRDVVSGDFYWCHRDGNRFIIAAVDCTGHGVAGAFMTFIGYKILNQVARDHHGLSAGQILSMLNQELIESLNQYQTGKTNAGMDIALCVFEDGKNTVEFAGANNPLYLLRNGEILQTKADKQGIGGKQKESNFQFTNNIVEIQKGDKIYLFSDGYAGQIGGPLKSEKFMYNRFRELLVEISSLPLEQREQVLESRFQGWRGDYEQLDDLLVIGLAV